MHFNLPKAYLLVLCTVMMFAACGNDNSEAEDKAPETPAEAVRQAMKGMSDKDKEPVDHRKLRDLLDERVKGFTRSQYSSQTAGAMSFTISNAEAEYETDDGRKIDVSLTDTGGLGSALMSMASWSKIQVDREDSNGWERTSTFQGNKSYERFDKSSQKTELAYIVDDRFVVVLSGTQCDMDDLKAFAKSLDLEDLKKL